MTNLRFGTNQQHEAICIADSAAGSSRVITTLNGSGIWKVHDGECKDVLHSVLLANAIDVHYKSMQHILCLLEVFKEQK